MTTVTLSDINVGDLGLSEAGLGKEGARVKTVKLQVPQIERKLKIIKGSDEPMVKGAEVEKSAEELIALLRDEAKVI